MIKKIILSLLLFFLMIPILVQASITPMAKVGDKYYYNLEEAIANTNSEDVITLISNVVLDTTLEINKVVNINLNGNNILSKQKVFQVKGGFLTISGKGIIKETEPYYGAIVLIGSNQSNDKKYSVVSVGEDVTLEGWSGIFINHESSKSYGVVAYLNGKINAVNDINGGSGVGIYVNGNIKEKENCPVVNISDTAEIISTGNGLYIAGYSNFNIDKAYISGIESGISMKSGVLNIDGATVICTGEDNTPTSGYNNGINPSGAAIQIESNNGYAGKIQIDISNGKFISKNSNVVYEYIGKGTSSLIYSMSLSNGTFISEKGKDVFSFSDSFKDIHSGFISGGQYSSNPNVYLKLGYAVITEGGIYSVYKNTLKTVFSNDISGGNSLFEIFINLIFLISLIILIYFNRRKIKDVLINLKNKFKKKS